MTTEEKFESEFRAFYGRLSPVERLRFEDLIHKIRSTAATAPITEFKNLLNEWIKPKDVPPVDLTKQCTTSGRTPEEVRADQIADGNTGQHKDYIVLCAEERAKGFVRPYREKYIHVGVGGHEIDPNNPARHGRTGNGCGVLTRMGRTIAETYSRSPSFYSHTFCCGCNKHLPVEEFVWEDGSVVGS